MGFKWANAVEIGTVTVRIMNLELFDFRFRTWNFELLILSFQLWRAYSSLDTRVSIYVSNQNFQYVFTCISFKTCQLQVQTPLKSTNLWSRNIFFVPRSVFDCVTLIQMTAVAIIFLQIVIQLTWLAQLAQVITRFRRLQIDLKTRLSDELSVYGIQFDLFIRLECLSNFFDFLENCHSVDLVGSVGSSDHKISNITNRS